MTEPLEDLPDISTLKPPPAMDDVLKAANTELLSGKDDIALYSAKVGAAEQFKANTLVFSCPIDAELTEKHPAGTSYAFVFGQSPSVDSEFALMQSGVDRSKMGTALIGDRNNVIDGKDGLSLREMFTARAEGQISPQGSDPASPQLQENVRTYVKNYCAPGS